MNLITLSIDFSKVIGLPSIDNKYWLHLYATSLPGIPNYWTWDSIEIIAHSIADRYGIMLGDEVSPFAFNPTTSVLTLSWFHADPNVLEAFKQDILTTQPFVAIFTALRNAGAVIV